MSASFLILCFSALALAAAPAKRSSCTITSYKQSGSMASCSSVTIAAQTVPAGQSLALTNLASGTTVTLAGNLVFGTGKYWTGNLLTISGGNIIFDGRGHTIDGNGAYYWDSLGTNGGKSKPKYTVALRHSGVFKDVTVKNVPGHAFSVQNPAALTITGVTYDNSAGDKIGSTGKALGHNTDAFDVSSSTNLVITGNTILNQDDCLAINSGTNIVFSNNVCKNGHGISIGSIKSNNKVSGVSITGNTIINSQNGLRIKTYSGATGASVKNVVYKNNKATGITQYGVVIVQDYTNSGETGTATSGVPIENVSFSSGNTVHVASNALEVKVLCGKGSCTGKWDWSGLTTTGSSKTSIVKGGAPIASYSV